mmetsp:Transcript_42612/g.89102  ORF Transcript_42612/g.89102 Transcript_42612/m.89102 type:complete len:88 (+) Transcript_42612:610-873(+)
MFAAEEAHTGGACNWGFAIYPRLSLVRPGTKHSPFSRTRKPSTPIWFPLCAIDKSQGSCFTGAILQRFRRNYTADAACFRVTREGNL